MPAPPQDPLDSQAPNFLLHLAWGSGFKKCISSTAASIIVATGVIVGIDNAWPIVEPGMPAHRGYTRDISESHKKEIFTKIAQTDVILRAIQNTQHDSQIDGANKGIEAADNEVDRLQLQLAKEQDDVSKLRLQETIRRNLGAKVKLENQIKSIEKEKAKNNNP